MLLLTSDFDEHLIEVPPIAKAPLFPSPSPYAVEAEPPVPVANGLVGDNESGLNEQIFDVQEAQGEAILELACGADDLVGKLMAGKGSFGLIHELSLPCSGST